MSKKGIALLLAAVMAFACTSAPAATDVVIDTGLPEFDVHFTADMDVEINSLAGWKKEKVLILNFSPRSSS